jgi:putative phosphoribosyl transferase
MDRVKAVYMVVTLQDPDAAPSGEPSSQLDDSVRPVNRVGARAYRERGQHVSHPAPDAREVVIEVAPGVVLRGELTRPSAARLRGLVLFVHASRLPRRDPRNRVVIAALGRSGLGTLLLDLLTTHEKVSHPTTTGVEVLAQRVVGAAQWLRQQPEAETMSLGYLGLIDSSSAVLLAAAKLPEDIGAVVSWGRGEDLHAAPLEDITAPVLLIADGHAEDLEHGFALRQRLKCPTDLAIVPGATGAFEHFGPVQRAARLTNEWFTRHLSEPASVAPPVSGARPRRMTRRGSAVSPGTR